MVIRRHTMRVVERMVECDHIHEDNKESSQIHINKITECISKHMSLLNIKCGMPYSIIGEVSMLYMP